MLKLTYLFLRSFTAANANNCIRFWKKTSEHCPETRVEIANQHRKSQQIDVKAPIEKPKRRLFAECGRPYSFNEPKLEFRFDDLPDRFVLDLHVHK